MLKSLSGLHSPHYHKLYVVLSVNKDPISGLLVLLCLFLGDFLGSCFEHLKMSSYRFLLLNLVDLDADMVVFEPLVEFEFVCRLYLPTFRMLGKDSHFTTGQ